MEQYIIVGLILLLIVGIDAIGDAFRFLGRGVAHHTMETLRIAAWIGLWASMEFEWVDFEWYYIAMYILARIWLFDAAYNLITGHPFLYVGTSDIYGRTIRWIANIFKVPYEHPAFITRLIAFIWWTAWLFLDGGILYKMIIFKES